MKWDRPIVGQSAAKSTTFSILSVTMIAKCRLMRRYLRCMTATWERCISSNKFSSCTPTHMMEFAISGSWISARGPVLPIIARIDDLCLQFAVLHPCCRGAVSFVQGTDLHDSRIRSTKSENFCFWRPWHLAFLASNSGLRTVLLASSSFVHSMLPDVKLQTLQLKTSTSV